MVTQSPRTVTHSPRTVTQSPRMVTHYLGTVMNPINSHNCSSLINEYSRNKWTQSTKSVETMGGLTIPVCLQLKQLDVVCDKFFKMAMKIFQIFLLAISLTSTILYSTHLQNCLPGCPLVANFIS